MSARDVFGGASNEYVLPARLGAPGNVLTVPPVIPAIGPSVLRWSTSSSQIIDSGTFTLSCSAGTGSGGGAATYETHLIGDTVAVSIQSVAGVFNFTAPNGVITSAPGAAPFASYAPVGANARGCFAIGLENKPIAGVWQVDGVTGDQPGRLTFFPNYGAPQNVSLSPGLMFWPATA